MNALSLANIDHQSEVPLATECVAEVRMLQCAPEAFFELQARDRQQDAVSVLAQSALNGETIERLLHHATELVAAGLEVEYVKFAELLPNAGGFRVRAGVGWRDGHVGRAMIGDDGDSQAGFTLTEKSAVNMHDIRSETRLCPFP